MLWIILAAIAFLAVVLWMLIETKSTLHLLWVIPTVIGLTVSVYSWAWSFFGYSTDVYTDGSEFTMLSYWIPPDESNIYVWVILRGEEEPKAIKLPYDPNEQEGLEEIAKQMADGKRFRGSFGPLEEEGDGDQEGTEEGESGGGTMKSTVGMINFVELTVEHFLPEKDYISEESSQVIQ